MKIGASSVDASDNAHLLGVLISADLSFDRHVTKVAGQCFYQLRQLRSVRKSLDADSAATLIRSFISSRVDYCCSLLVGRFTAISHEQTPESDECSRPSYHEHWQVWARSVIFLASGTSLAGCARTDSVQSCCYSIPLSSQHGSAVPSGGSRICKRGGQGRAPQAQVSRRRRRRWVWGVGRGFPLPTGGWVWRGDTAPPQWGGRDPLATPHPPRRLRRLDTPRLQILDPPLIIGLSCQCSNIDSDARFPSEDSKYPARLQYSYSTAQERIVISATLRIRKPKWLFIVLRKKPRTKTLNFTKRE